MKKKQSINPASLVSILFTVIVVVAMLVIFLLSGRRRQTADALEQSAITPTPDTQSVSAGKTSSYTSSSGKSSSAAKNPSAGGSDASEKTPKSTAVPTPTPVPVGVSQDAFFASLSACGIVIADTDRGITVSVEADPVYYNTGLLSLDPHDTYVHGYVLSYPAIDTGADNDGSAISAALAMSSSELLIKSQSLAMETTFYAVMESYDPNGLIPLTVRNEWCAKLLSFLSDKSKKSFEDTCGKFRFSIYPYGSGQDMLVCFSVQYTG